MKLFIAEGKIELTISIKCPFCEERQPLAENDFFRLLGKMIVCENIHCSNYFRLPVINNA